MSSISTQACAACKYQRRKCAPDCPLAPYFPPDHPKQFLNVHRLFGVSNVLRILRQVSPSLKADAIKSIVYEADAWERDPVHGCLGLISLLRNQVEDLQLELARARSQIFFLEHSNQTNSLHLSAVNPTLISTNPAYVNPSLGSTNLQTSEFGLSNACVFSHYQHEVPVQLGVEGLAVFDENVGSHESSQSLRQSFEGIVENNHAVKVERIAEESTEAPSTLYDLRGAVSTSNRENYSLYQGSSSTPSHEPQINSQNKDELKTIALFSL
ncbi:hypothetical protein L7F22_052100 [Adiantum nelumboides]|nr:hypothetical protein [Adiantum nelumboides]